MYLPEHKLKTIVADGDFESAQKISHLLTKCCTNIEVVSVCATKEQAVKAIREYKPGLVILDMEFPDGNGFDLLQLFPVRDFSVIFITGKSEYAARAFRYSVSDYLLKPLNGKELAEAIKKVTDNCNELNSVSGILSHLEKIRTPEESPATLVVSNAKGFNVLKLSEIIYLEANGYCTGFYLEGNKKISSAYNLKYYGDLLPAEMFMRVHHSYIVNLNHVKGYNTQDEIVLTENLHCSLSDAQKQHFLKYFKVKK